MMKTLGNLFDYIFSLKSQKSVENTVLFLATLGFIIHLLLIFLNNFSLINITVTENSLLSNPISAIYTPFSFIIIYEIYLLLLFLPRSFTTSISKQFEIISLIIIRKIFKDISNLDLSDSWNISNQNLEVLSDLVGIIILFYIIYLFNKNKNRMSINKEEPVLLKFINSKKIVSLTLLAILTIFSSYSLINWVFNLFNDSYSNTMIYNEIDKVFFNDFFTLLILTDVIILLLSFKITEGYSKLIRNTGFVISTILIRLSFSAEGFLDIFIILISSIFALLILKIYNSIEKTKSF
ncbi:MAG: hypothetical protein CMC40_06585 [Flavobacteriaceae bacterium]|nr:hypothetical protein [Flavobacteriaceae bacterium]